MNSHPHSQTNQTNPSVLNHAAEKPVLIDKEIVSELRFPVGDVLQHATHIENRRSEIERAVYLGNTEHAKVRILFEDAVGYKQVETTLWASTDNRVILKGGMVIPIHRIREVKIHG
jgi:uncharacterized protein (UPF0248 family)